MGEGQSNWSSVLRSYVVLEVETVDVTTHWDFTRGITFIGRAFFELNDQPILGVDTLKITSTLL
jgi:hypothetical protein